MKKGSGVRSQESEKRIWKISLFPSLTPDSLLLTPILLLLLSTTSLAITLERRLENPAQEQQAEAIFRQLRCMVCDGESLHDSKADLAKDMREHIRQDIEKGKTEKEITHSLQQAYGDQILIRPPLKTSTLLLWLAPVIFLIIGFFLLFRSSYRK